LEDIEAIYELARSVSSDVRIESDEYENLTPSTIRQLPNDSIETLNIDAYDVRFHIVVYRGIHIHLWTSSREQSAVDLVEAVRKIIEKRENKFDKWLRQSRYSFLVFFSPWIILIALARLFDSPSIFQVGLWLYLVLLIAMTIWKSGFWDRRRSSVVPRYRREATKRGVENRDVLIITIVGGVFIAVILYALEDIAKWFIGLF